MSVNNNTFHKWTVREPGQLEKWTIRDDCCMTVYYHDSFTTSIPEPWILYIHDRFTVIILEYSKFIFNQFGDL